MNEQSEAARMNGTCPSAGSVGFRLTTLPHIDGKITQELQEYMGEQTRTLSRWVIDSREKGVHDALVQLGWTPPNTGAHRMAPAAGASTVPPLVGKIKCSQCGREHDESRSNCCWITCECTARICGGCGSTNIVNMEMSPDDDEAQYWCCQECADCGLQGCAMCI